MAQKLSILCQWRVSSPTIAQFMSLGSWEIIKLHYNFKAVQVWPYDLFGRSSELDFSVLLRLGSVAFLLETAIDMAGLSSKILIVIDSKRLLSLCCFLRVYSLGCVVCRRGMLE